jgi:complement component 1 Q subcomponent-binding protein
MKSIPSPPPLNTTQDSLTHHHRIRITFSISDLTNENLQEPYQEDPDRALFDDEDPQNLDGQSGGANTKGAINSGKTSGGNIRVAPEDRVAPADRPELDDEAAYDEDAEAQPAFPARVNVKVTRDGKAGAVLIEATAQDGEIIIENVYYFADAAQADPESSDADWKRRAVYAGPPFGNLDDELQVLLERYLEERGVDVRLANFIPEYIDFKEQKEYLRWLQSTCFSFQLMSMV